jgi:hypothetical protein
LPFDGALRFLDIDLDSGDTSHCVYSIVEGDPLSAEVRFHAASDMGRGDWQTRSEVKSSMTCDAESFHVEATLDVHENGEVIWGDKLMIRFSRAPLAQKPGATILGEVKCSQTLYDDIAKHGGQPVVWKTGHSLIKTRMKETGALRAGEIPGHVARQSAQAAVRREEEGMAGVVLEPLRDRAGLVEEAQGLRLLDPGDAADLEQGDT